MKIDNEYATSNIYEMMELRKHGVRYTFAKVVDGVTLWKYKKTPELFNILQIFYSKSNSER